MSRPISRPARAGSQPPASQWRELADLPFAAVLVPHRDGWQPGAEYDCAHFDQLTLDRPDGSGSRFLECAITHVSCQGGQLRRATFTDAWLADVRLTGTGLAESAWTGVQVADSAIAGAEAFGARWRGVALRGCKLDSVNLRDALLDLRGAELGITADPGSLRGMVVTPAQFAAMSGLLATTLGITVEDK